MLGTRFRRAIPLTFVLGYPKSGTTWVCQLVADYLQLPFPRYSLLPIGFPAVVHGHELVSAKYPRGVYSIRDGRDAMVSRYFFLLRDVPEGDNPAMPPNLRRFFPKLRNKADVKENLTPFLEEEFQRPRFGAHWGRHVASYVDARHPKFVMLRYEDLLGNGPNGLDGPDTLAGAMSALTGDEPDRRRAELAVEKFSFDRQKKQKAGQDQKYLRKGGSGDWRNHFTKEAAELFDRYAGDMLVAAGYEKDRSWVSEFASGAPAERAEATR